jgi:hypothetical protein
MFGKFCQLVNFILGKFCPVSKLYGFNLIILWNTLDLYLIVLAFTTQCTKNRNFFNDLLLPHHMSK